MMARTGARRSDQGLIWQDIASKSVRRGFASATEAMSEMYDHERTLSAAGLGESTGAVQMKRGRCLPAVTCIASFRSPEPPECAGAGIFTGSTAAVVWFQDDFAFPPGAEILREIRALDWALVAADVSD